MLISGLGIWAGLLGGQRGHARYSGDQQMFLCFECRGCYVCAITSDLLSLLAREKEGD